MSEEVKYLSHGTFETKITEMIYRCWEIRRNCETDIDLRRYINVIRATYMVLPKSTKDKANNVLNLLNKSAIIPRNVIKHINPLRRNTIILVKKYEYADKALESLVEVLDKDNLLILRDQYTPWNVGVDADRFNPEKDIVPDFKTMTGDYLYGKKLESKSDESKQ